MPPAGKINTEILVFASFFGGEGSGKFSPMADWIEIQDYDFPNGWQGDAQARARRACEQLESGRTLYFAQPPFDLSEADREFLGSQRRADSSVHKNASYRPDEDALHGFDAPAPARERLRGILRHYSEQAVEFVRRFLAPYDGHYKLDYASFRPLEEDGRKLPLHKRNDLLHVDAFPSRPTHGGRILRLFTNVHPSKMRVWIVGEEFPALARRLALDAGLFSFAVRGGSSSFTRFLRACGAPLPDRSAYDRFMLRFHDYLKENSRYQQDCQKTRMEFPPMSTWLVFTDGVPHAVLSGQHALEQTFIVSREGLVAPQFAPISVLEALCGRPLAPSALA